MGQPRAARPNEIDPVAVWFRGQVKDVTGVDLGAPPEGPLPELLVDWTS